MSSTIGRVVAGVFTLGLSEAVGGMFSKSTPAPVTPTVAKVDETGLEQKEKVDERRRRQAIARANRNIKTSPLGAEVNQNLLGGPTLTGQ